MKLERTRASEARPARAMPRWESMPMTFFWYEESSSALRYSGEGVVSWRVEGDDGG